MGCVRVEARLVTGTTPTPVCAPTRRIHQLHAPLSFAGGLVRHHDGGAALVLDAQIDTARRLARLVAFADSLSYFFRGA